MGVGVRGGGGCKKVCIPIKKWGGGGGGMQSSTILWKGVGRVQKFQNYDFSILSALSS